MKVYIAGDHGGVALKASLLKSNKNSIEFVDLGPATEDRVDYPDYADKVCESIKSDPKSMGVLVCRSGQGMSMRANKYPFIRAALCFNQKMAELSRQHNNANVLCIGADCVSNEQALEILNTFVNTPFEGGRHEARVKKIGASV